MNTPLSFLTDVPVTFDLDAISAKLHIRPANRNALDRLAKLAEEAKAIARPKAAYKLCGVVLADGGKVDIEGITFTSALLHEKLGALGRVFPYLATEGKEIADWGLSLPSSLDQFFACALREAALTQCRELLEKTVLAQYGLRQVSSMNPGSLAIWPLEEQKPFFQLMEPAHSQLSLTLLSSMMMQPEFSVSGLFFQTDRKYHNCQLCPREDCLNRKAPFIACYQKKP